MNIVSLLCKIDGFFIAHEKKGTPQGLPETCLIEARWRPRHLHPRELMTIAIAFQQSGYRTFKHFHLQTRLRLLAYGVPGVGELCTLRAVEKRRVFGKILFGFRNIDHGLLIEKNKYVEPSKTWAFKFLSAPSFATCLGGWCVSW